MWYYFGCHINNIAHGMFIDSEKIFLILNLIENWIGKYNEKPLDFNDMKSMEK